MVDQGCGARSRAAMLELGQLDLGHAGRRQWREAQIAAHVGFSSFFLFSKLIFTVGHWTASKNSH